VPMTFQPAPRPPARSMFAIDASAFPILLSSPAR
jgi:hypothetical protein